MARGIQQCRACGVQLEAQILDLGTQPVADAFLAAEDLAVSEPTSPLTLAVCTSCWLVQLGSTHDSMPEVVHGHGAGYSRTVLEHDTAWAHQLHAQLRPCPSAYVLDVACEDGHLLAAFAKLGARVGGIEALPAAAETARRRGLPVRTGTFGLDMARELVADGVRADLILVNHALAHVADFQQYLAALELVLAPGGSIAIAFHHILGLAQRKQFDVVCHAHLSYLGVHSLDAAVARHGLQVVDAEAVPVYGGSIRAVVRRTVDDVPTGGRARELWASERAAGLHRLGGYRQIQLDAAATRQDLLAFLRTARAAGKSVVAYGAPSRGITLLNACGIAPDQIPFTVDRAERKQGLWLPGCRIPVLPPASIDDTRPDYVLILPWPLADEIVEQLAHVSSWGGRFVVALPELRVLG